MNQIKRFISCNIPVFSCNLKCKYCYVGQHQDAFTKGILQFIISPAKVVECLSVKRLGGVCYFNLCGNGETMLHPQLIPLVKALLQEGHYTDIITNGTLTNKLIELVDLLTEDEKKHLLIKFSFHYLELKRLNILDKFVENVNLIKNANISFSIEITPHDELIPYIDEIKMFSMEHFFSLPHITVARDETTKDILLLTKKNREELSNIWKVFNSSLFDFKLSIFNVKRKEFCYAGIWSLYVNLLDGNYFQCYKGDLLGNIKHKKDIVFRAIGKCRMPHCYNGHAFLALGNIPDLVTPTYAEERNRKTINNDNWLNEDCNSFFSSKLSDSNLLFDINEKKRLLFLNNFFFIFNYSKKTFIKVINKLHEAKKL